MRACSWVAAAGALVVVAFASCGGDEAVGGGASGDDGGGGGADATGGDAGASGDGSPSGEAGDGGPASAWLRVQGNRIVKGDGSPFHGRGANLHDTRSCNACTYLDPDVGEVNRRADELVDAWHASFVRFDLESYTSSDGYRKPAQIQGVLTDAQYLADVQAMVGHITQKGAYVLLSAWIEPSTTATEWPTAGTQQVWGKLAAAFADEPRVMFGLVNEPHDDASKNDQLWTAMSETVKAVRAAEKPGQAHVVLVQGANGYAREVSYWIAHPITGPNVAYEVHIYNPQSDFDALVVQPSRSIPLVIGEFGPFSNPTMTVADCQKLMEVAEANDVPWVAWNFHHKCPPNLLEDTAGGACGVGMTLTPSAGFGVAVKNRLAQPW